MKTHLLSLLVLSVIFVLTGCASDNLAKFYEPYEGAQQNWPISSGGYVSKVRGVTFYHGLPPHPYAILGRYDRPNISPTRVADSAKYHHADAVCLIEHDMDVEQFNPGVTFGNSRVSVTTPSTREFKTVRNGTAYLITFNPTNSS